MSAEAFSNLCEKIAIELGAGDMATEITGFIADIILGGGKDIGKQMVNDEIITGLLNSGQLTDDVFDILETYLKNLNNDQNSSNDNEQQNKNEHKKEEEKKNKEEEQ